MSLKAKLLALFRKELKTPRGEREGGKRWIIVSVDETVCRLEKVCDFGYSRRRCS